MIEAVFTRNKQGITAFTVSGHADFCDGDDIVCASVSSAVMMTANTLVECAGIAAEISVLENKISVERKGSGKEEFWRVICEGFHLHMMNLEEDYPDNIKVIDLEV